jgi:uncharacterized membrane protein
MAGTGGDGKPEIDEPPELGDLYDQIAEIEDLVETEEARAQVREAMDLALDVEQRPVFGRIIRGFDASDVMEAFLGALLLGIPMFVESGTTEIGAFIATQPLFLVVTHAVALAIVIGILYVADIQDVRIHNPILGLVPRRLVGVIGAAMVTAAVMMSVWGRVDWGEPWVAICTVSVAYLPMAIGAALGDILPGT